MPSCLHPTQEAAPAALKRPGARHRRYQLPCITTVTPASSSRLAARATPPPAASVHGLGIVDALRIDLDPEQLPWLAAEIDTFRYRLEDEPPTGLLAITNRRGAEKQDRRGPGARGRAGTRAPRLPAEGPRDDRRAGADWP